MKRNAPNAPKMKRLKRQLGLNLFEAVGLLEMLWHFTAQYAPAGDIGKHTDEEIEDFLEWPVKKSGKLVPALISAKWIDTDEKARLIVHDWSDHSDDSVDRYLARNGLNYANGFAPRNKKTKTDDENPQETGHDASKRGMTTSRARGLMPEAREPEPVPESGDDSSPAQEAFQILTGHPMLRGLAANGWAAMRQALGAHPKFSAFDLVAWAKKMAGDGDLRGEVDLWSECKEPAKRLKVHLEAALNGGFEGQKNTGGGERKRPAGELTPEEKRERTRLMMGETG